MPYSRAAAISPLLTNQRILSSSEIRALSSIPLVLIPTPGAGRLITVLGWSFTYNFGTRAYFGTEITQPYPYYASDPSAFIATTQTGAIVFPSSCYAYATGGMGVDVDILPGADNQPVLMSADTDYGGGPITTATLGAGGLGYVANDTGTITNGANDATYKVLTVGAGGAVLTFQITGAGTACTVANGNATVDGGAQPGVGVGFTINITAVNAGDGTLKVVIYYQIINVP